MVHGSGVFRSLGTLPGFAGMGSGGRLAWMISSSTCPGGIPRRAALTLRRLAESVLTRAVIGIQSSCRFGLATAPPNEGNPGQGFVLQQINELGLLYDQFFSSEIESKLDESGGLQCSF